MVLLGYVLGIRSDITRAGCFPRVLSGLFTFEQEQNFDMAPTVSASIRSWTVCKLDYE